mmetsp:Transcript_48416/g.156151  ORF Transcript_48416/g.156151 Transcript_48416/m.156151 type:complete len:238 (+) Transcript_48416:256-969(+)
MERRASRRVKLDLVVTPQLLAGRRLEDTPQPHRPTARRKRRRRKRKSELDRRPHLLRPQAPRRIGDRRSGLKAGRVRWATCGLECRAECSLECSLECRVGPEACGVGRKANQAGLSRCLRRQATMPAADPCSRGQAAAAAGAAVAAEGVAAQAVAGTSTAGARVSLRRPVPPTTSPFSSSRPSRSSYPCPRHCWARSSASRHRPSSRSERKAGPSRSMPGTRPRIRAWSRSQAPQRP